MDSTLSPKEADPDHDKKVPLAPDDFARAEDALTKLVQEAARPDLKPQTVVAGSDFSATPRVAAPSIEVEPRPPGRDRAGGERKSGGRRAGRTLFRFLLAACIGIAATLAWQSYGEAARQMVATFVPALGRSSPPGMMQPLPAAANENPNPAAVQANAAGAAPARDAALAQAAPISAAPASPELAQEIKAIARDLAAVRQRVEQLAAGQEQMSRTIAKLQAAEEDARQKPAAPVPAPQPAHKPVTKPPRPAPQALAPGPRPLWQSFAPPPDTARPQPPQPRPPAGMP